MCMDCVTLLVEHDVFRLEVSVYNTIRVEVTEGQRDLSKVEAAQKTKFMMTLQS